MGAGEADSTGEESVGEVDWTESDIGAMGRADIGNAGDIGNADDAVSGVEMSEAISDGYEASKPETRTVDAGVWCISGS